MIVAELPLCRPFRLPFSRNIPRSIAFDWLTDQWGSLDDEQARWDMLQLFANRDTPGCRAYCIWQAHGQPTLAEWADRCGWPILADELRATKAYNCRFHGSYHVRGLRKEKREPAGSHGHNYASLRHAIGFIINGIVDHFCKVSRYGGWPFRRNSSVVTRRVIEAEVEPGYRHSGRVVQVELCPAELLYYRPAERFARIVDERNPRGCTVAQESLRYLRDSVKPIRAADCKPRPSDRPRRPKRVYMTSTWS